MVTVKLGALAALLAALPIQVQRQPSPYERDPRSCQAEVKQLRDQLASQRREFKDLEGRFGECQTARDNLATENRDLNRKLTQQRRDDSEPQTSRECRRLEAQLKDCESARDKLAKENRDLSNKLAQGGRGEGDERLRRELKKLESNLSDCQTERNNLAAANRDLNKRLSSGDFEERLRTAQAAAERYRTQYAALQREKEQLAGQVNEVSRHRDDLDRQLQAANLSLQQTRAELAAFRSGQQGSSGTGETGSSEGNTQTDGSSRRPASHNVGAILLRAKTSSPQQTQK